MNFHRRSYATFVLLLFPFIHDPIKFMCKQGFLRSLIAHCSINCEKSRPWPKFYWLLFASLLAKEIVTPKMAQWSNKRNGNGEKEKDRLSLGIQVLTSCMKLSSLARYRMGRKRGRKGEHLRQMGSFQPYSQYVPTYECSTKQYLKRPLKVSRIEILYVLFLHTLGQ